MLSFYWAYAITMLVLVLPGSLFLRGAGLPRTWSVALSPLATVGLITILGQIFVFVGIAGSVLTLLVPLVLLGAVMSLLRRHKGLADASLHQLGWATLALYVCVGAFLGYYLVYRCLIGPGALFQDWDLGNHINTTRAIMDSGRFSSLGSGIYLTQADLAIAPMSSNGFYPSGAYFVYALVCEISRVELATCINATNLAFASIVFPLGSAAFLSEVFPESRRTVLVGSVFCLSLVGCPWGLLTFGPLFPNLAGMSCAPIPLMLFVAATTASERSMRDRLRLVALFVLALIGLFSLHPNAVFTVATLLIPYVTYRIASLDQLRIRQVRVSLPLAILFLVACAFVWYRAFLITWGMGVSSMVWPLFTGKWQEVINILTQTYTNGFIAPCAANFIPAAFVILGGLKLCFDKERRWMVLSYLVACVICYVGATTDGTLKQILAGFWYTDPVRLAAMASLAAIPLVSVGATSTIDAIEGWTAGLAHRYGLSGRRHVVTIVAVLFVLVFVPGFSIPGEGELATAFGSFRQDVHNRYCGETPISDAERSFLDQAAEITGDSLVINNPLDGSQIAYGLTGMRTYYRQFRGFGSTLENSTSETIRSRLSSFSTDPSVREALQSVGAEYVIILADPADPNSYIMRDPQNILYFAGIMSLNGTTSGFQEVLTSTDRTCHLYRIEY